MANQYHNSGGSNSKHGNQQGNNKSSSKKNTMAELVKEVLDKYFKGLENDLLLLNDITKIKSIFSSLESFTDKISEGLTASQLRNVYSKILEAETPLELQLLRPNLAYVAARNKNNEAKEVMAFIDYLIQQVNSPEKQKSFNKVLEAIVAYHKYSTSKL